MHSRRAGDAIALSIFNGTGDLYVSNVALSETHAPTAQSFTIYDTDGVSTNINFTPYITDQDDSINNLQLY